MSARKKVLISFFVIFASLTVIFYLKNKSQNFSQFSREQDMKQQEKKAELRLQTPTVLAKVGEQFSISLFLETRTSDISSFDAVVSYDPETVRIDEIKTTGAFPLYTRKLIEDFKNRFVISGVQTDLNKKLDFSSKELAEVLVTPLKKGKAEFSFIIEGKKYTNLTSASLADVPFNSNKLVVEVKE